MRSETARACKQDGFIAAGVMRSSNWTVEPRQTSLQEKSISPTMSLTCLPLDVLAATLGMLPCTRDVERLGQSCQVTQCPGEPRCARLGCHCRTRFVC